MPRVMGKWESWDLIERDGSIPSRAFELVRQFYYCREKGALVETRTFVVFCSPAGSTRHVAGVIEQELMNLRSHPITLDLGRQRDWSSIMELFNKSRAGNCLFIGSPVYRDLAVPPVMEFIKALPKLEKSFAVPFITWGGASSGIALWEMGQALLQKGFAIAGAAKVLGAHSLMWDEATPLGNGHPDTEDDSLVKELVRTVATNSLRDNARSLSLEQLDYQPEAQGTEMKKNLSQPRPVTPRTVDEAKCNECAVCEYECPVAAITLSPYPEFSSSCFDCFNCIRCCPERAINPKISLDKLHGMIRKHAETMNESPFSQIFT